jgi:2,4-didehydro-3-deoxy-L-rhamnonate hydrolase
MRIVRFGSDRVGIEIGDEVVDVTRVLDRLPAHRYPLPVVDPLIAHLDELRPFFEQETKIGKRQKLAGLDLKSPIANPGKVIGAPVNYKKHLDEARADASIHFQNKIIEIQQIGLFLKANSSVVGPSEGIAIRHADRRNDHEVELGVIIGTTADRVSRGNALKHVAGYCIGLDMTVRGQEERSLRKSVDSFTVLGPCLVTADEISDPSNLSLSLTVNGEPRQSANTRDLLISIPDLIVFASSFYTLKPGDVILTGTPEGVGPVVPGDTIEASIESIGSMSVSVRRAN